MAEFKSASPTSSLGVRGLDRQWQSIVGLVLAILGLLSSLTLPVLLAVQSLSHSSDPTIPALALVLNVVAVVLSTRGRHSRLFGVAVAGMIVSLLGAVIAGVLLLYVTATLLAGVLPSQSGALFIVDGVSRFCDRNTGDCTVEAGLKNNGFGPGSATALVAIVDSPNPGARVLGQSTCDSASARVGESVELKCTVRSAELRAYLNSSQVTNGPEARVEITANRG
jgi:hypothetical protein